jgi:hypothetical protein
MSQYAALLHNDADLVRLIFTATRRSTLMASFAYVELPGLAIVLPHPVM